MGEDILILNDIPFPFSVIAKTEVVALRISKHDLQNKIPSDFRHLLEENSKNRNKWMQNRVKSITNTSQIIYRQDHKQTVYDTVMTHLCSQHPQATSNAVKSFTRHHINATGMDNSGRIIKRVSTNHRKSDHKVIITNEDLSLNMLKSKSRDSSAYQTKPNLRMNKAAFSLQPINPSFEYQNLSGDLERNTIHEKAKSAHPNVFIQPKKSIDFSFSNMKLKNGRVDTSSIYSHQNSVHGNV